MRYVRWKHNITDQKLYLWRNKHRGDGSSRSAPARGVGIRRRQAKRMVAEQMLVIDELREFNRKK